MKIHANKMKYTKKNNKIQPMKLRTYTKLKHLRLAVKSAAKILFLKRARDPKSVESSNNPFHTAITLSVKNSDLTRVLVDF